MTYTVNKHTINIEYHAVGGTYLVATTAVLWQLCIADLNDVQN